MQKVSFREDAWLAMLSLDDVQMIKTAEQRCPQVAKHHPTLSTSDDINGMPCYVDDFRDYIIRTTKNNLGNNMATKQRPPRSTSLSLCLRVAQAYLTAQPFCQPRCSDLISFTFSTQPVGLTGHTLTQAGVCWAKAHRSHHRISS